MARAVVIVICWVVIAAGALSSAHAALRFTADQTASGVRFVIVEGEFEYGDDLGQFAAVVKSHNPTAVGFRSPGGNVYKAMELGRLIRSYRLSTVQPRGFDCSSACALGFFGGVARYADPGAIGVHKSSFANDLSLSAADAVSVVQHMTADVITYMVEMGIDPALLQLSLKYDSDDIRFLSRSEMEQFKVTTHELGSNEPQASQSPPLAAAPQHAIPQPSVQKPNSFAIPEPRTGRVRHPKGPVPLKSLPSGESVSLANLPNGTPVTILGNVDRWYNVSTAGRTGYLHHTWVFVDQYDSGPFNQRHIQVKSFDNLADAEAYVRNATIPLSAYLATNGWFAVTLAATFDSDTAVRLVKKLKSQRSVPDDAFVVYGNTYVRKVCCN